MNPKQLIASIGFIFCASVGANEESAPIDPYIEWRVANPFPFLKSRQDVDALVNGLNRIALSSEYDSYASAVEAAYKNTAWNPRTKSYDRSIIHRETTIIEARVVGLPTTTRCTWNSEGKNGVDAICGEWASFSVAYTNPRHIAASWKEGSTEKSLGTTPSVQRKIIIGLGDSFSSGEGNPDRPSRWAEAKINKSESTYYQKRWATFYNPSTDELADWNDVSCHRSLFSWQFMYALNQTNNRPHVEVIFASFACSGAEIYDGLLVRQSDKNENFKAPDSQLNEATKLLCSSEVSIEHNGRQEHLLARRSVEIYTSACPLRDRLPADEVLLTIGGNDVGFSGLLAWAIFPPYGYNFVTTNTAVKLINNALIPKTGMICPQLDSLKDKRCKRHTSAEIEAKKLNEKLPFAHKLIAAQLGATPNNILQLTYPSPSRDEKGQICDFDRSATASIALKNELFKDITKIDPLERVGLNFSIVRWRYGKYNVGPYHTRVSEIERVIAAPLLEIMTSQRGATVINASHQFTNRGFCASSGKWDLEMATRHKTGGIWWPRDVAPSIYNPWNNVARWFRTPNDAQLTMYSDSLYGSNAWLSGSFHPNHLGNYAMFRSIEYRSNIKTAGSTQSSR